MRDEEMTCQGRGKQVNFYDSLLGGSCDGGRRR